MTRNKLFLAIGFLGLAVVGLIPFATNRVSPGDKILSYTVETKSQDLQFYWQDGSAKIFKSILNLKTRLESKHKTLVFAMNGGMFKKDNSPQGLFIQHHKTLTPLDTSSGNGNFYLKPNGVFYITTDKQASISKTADFRANGQIQFATQSGPMLVIDGQIHSTFKDGSTNLNIRNGVGILPDNKVVFAMSKTKINFYDFAKYFRDLGCKNALYLDGSISRTYLPEKQWTQTDGNFGVIIGVIVQQ